MSPVNSPLRWIVTVFGFLARVVEDLDLARPDDEEFEVAVADCEEGLPVPVQLRSGHRAMSQLGDLGLVKGREGDGMETVLDCGSAAQCVTPVRRWIEGEFPATMLG